MSTKDGPNSLQFSEWSEWKGTELEWDQTLLKLADYNIYQSSSWANHRADFGWNKNSVTACDLGDAFQKLRS